jgi:FAD/FMN-containing dehydrogenase
MEKNLEIINFGHIGDGNIHVNIMIDGKNKEAVKKAAEAVKEIFKITLSLGGTISGEHGIGITKAPYLNMELGETEINIQKEIKKIFDPKGLLNTGKIFYVS